MTDTLYVSPRWKAMIGLPADARVERSDHWFRDVQPDDLAGFRRALDEHLSGATPHLEHEYRVTHMDGSTRWVLCRGVAVRDESGRAIRIAGSQTDVTERRQVQDDLAHAALHDSLTGLANRTLFAAMLVRVKSRDVLLPVLLYPITVPVIIAGVRATAALLEPQLDTGIIRFWLALLTCFDVVFVTLALWTFEAIMTD